VAPAVAQPQSRFQQLLQAKLAAEKSRPAAVATPPPQLANAHVLSRLQSADTVFNTAFSAPYYGPPMAKAVGPDTQKGPNIPVQSYPYPVDQVYPTNADVNYNQDPSAKQLLIPRQGCVGYNIANAPAYSREDVSTRFRPLVDGVANQYTATAGPAPAAALAAAPFYAGAAYNGVPETSSGYWIPQAGVPTLAPYQQMVQANFNAGHAEAAPSAIASNLQSVRAESVPAAWQHATRDEWTSSALAPAVQNPVQPAFDSLQSAYPFLWPAATSLDQHGSLLSPNKTAENIGLDSSPNSIVNQPMPITPKVSNQLFESQPTQQPSNRLPAPYAWESEVKVEDRRSSYDSPIKRSHNVPSLARSPSLRAYGSAMFTNMNGQIKLPPGLAMASSGGDLPPTLGHWEGGDSGNGGHDDHHHNGHNDDMSGSQMPMFNLGKNGGDEEGGSKKLVLACHFCRGRKLK
jgi:hypothetical protein